MYWEWKHSVTGPEPSVTLQGSPAGVLDVRTAITR
jgi:hypothetical protein